MKGAGALNIYDIAERAGVSIATVSRVLNNSTHVSEATRNRILAVMDESKYVPNAFARGLGLNSMKTIGLVCPDAGDPYLAEALKCLESDFRAKGYNCLLVCTGHDPEGRRKGVREMLDRHVDSMVLMGSSFIEENSEDNAYLRDAAESVPVFLLNGSYTAPGVYCAVCNDSKATEDATEYLYSLGSRRILFLYHNLNNSGRRKMDGYRNGLEKAGIPFDPDLAILVKRDNNCISNVRKALEQLQNRNISYDAVLTTEDILAVGVLKYAACKGIKVPGQLRVIGYNNSLLCNCTEPELSSMDNKVSRLCECIVENLTAVMQGETCEKESVLEAELIPRGTT